MYAQNVIVQRALLMVASHHQIKSGLLDLLSPTKFPISGVIFDPLYHIDGRERNHPGTICMFLMFFTTLWYINY